jgi:hypothetical protein
MRTTLTLAALVLSFVPAASAHANHPFATVDSLYVRYVGHRPNPVVRHELVHRLLSGAPVLHIEAAILGSHDYFLHHGHSEAGFIHGMFHDVTGRHPSRHETAYWMGRLDRVGHSRYALALEFLRETRYAAPVAVGYTPAPVVITPPAPVVVAPPILPAYPVTPRTGLSISFNLR